MKKCIVIILAASIWHPSFSQKSQSWIALETDPITTVFGAKTLSILVEPPQIKNWSFFFNIVSADFPNWIDDLLNKKNKGKGIESKIALGGGFSIDYFVLPEKKGYYFGLINLFFNNKISARGQSRKFISHNIIPRAGYRWHPFKKTNFFINPFVGLRYEYLFKEHILSENLTYEAAGFGPFGSVHIGYKF